MALSQLLSGDDSGGLSGHGGGEVVPGGNLSASSWGNVVNEISKECVGTAEVLVSVGGIEIGYPLPFCGGVYVLNEGGDDIGGESLCGFSSTNYCAIPTI